jgi:hypothetical protein
VFLAVIGKIFGGLDVILVGIGPVKMNFLPVVRDRVFLASGIPP